MPISLASLLLIGGIDKCVVRYREGGWLAVLICRLLCGNQPMRYFH